MTVDNAALEGSPQAIGDFAPTASGADMVVAAPPRTSATGRFGRRRRVLLAGCCISVLTVIVADVAIGIAFCRDGMFRHWPLPPYSLIFKDSQLEWLQKDDWPYYVFDADLGWTLRPDGVFAGRRYRANSAGIRADREYALKPPPGVIRIAAFGDSYVHGDSVDNTETALAILEQSRDNLEVLNFGVPGYGTDQAYVRYQRDGAKYRPHIVLIGIMLENIQRNVSAFRTTYYHQTGLPLPKPRFRLNSSDGLELVPCPVRSLGELRESVESGRLLETLSKTDYWVGRIPIAYRDSPIFGSSLVRIVCGAYESRGRDQRIYFNDVAGEPFRVTVAILREFRAEAIADGAERAIVVVLPDKCTIRQQLAGEPKFWHTLTDALASADVPYIDLTPALMEAVRRDGVDANFNGTHYNAKGNAVVAEALRRSLFP